MKAIVTNKSPEKFEKCVGGTGQNFREHLAREEEKLHEILERTTNLRIAHEGTRWKYIRVSVYKYIPICIYYTASSTPRFRLREVEYLQRIRCDTHSSPNIVQIIQGLWLLPRLNLKVQTRSSNHHNDKVKREKLEVNTSREYFQVLP